MRRLNLNALRAGLLATLGSGLLASGMARAQTELVVYDNTTTRLGPLFDVFDETGDEITLLPPAGGSWTVTEFEVGYVGFFPEDGDEAIVVRFYANDGAGGAPGTLIFQSAPQPVFSPESFSIPEVVVLTGLSEAVPLTFTWSVELVGFSLTGGDVASLPSFGPPTVGSSDEDEFWVLLAGFWSIETGLPDSSNFHARVTALPEADAFVSMIAGAWMLAALRRRRRARTGRAALARTAAADRRSRGARG